MIRSPKIMGEKVASNSALAFDENDYHIYILSNIIGISISWEDDHQKHWRESQKGGTIVLFLSSVCRYAR